MKQNHFAIAVHQQVENVMDILQLSQFVIRRVEVLRRRQTSLVGLRA